MKKRALDNLGKAVKMSYFRPLRLSEAVAWLAENDARIIAGCTDLFPATAASDLEGPLLDVTAIEGLGEISFDDDHWRIGAAATWSRILTADLPPAFGALKQAATEVGSVQIQNVGTIVGNICNASPAADGVPALLILGASVELVSSGGARVVALEDFLLGPRRTACAPDEIVTAILIPKAAAEGHSTFLKLGARKYLVISIAMVAARLSGRDGVVEQAAVAVGACSAVATRLAAVEQVLIGQPFDSNLSACFTDDLVTTQLSPIGDVRGNESYRLSTATTLVRRAITELAQSYGGGDR